MSTEPAAAQKTPRFIERAYQKQEEYLRSIDGNPAAKIDLTKLVDRRGLDQSALRVLRITALALPATLLWMFLVSELKFEGGYLVLFYWVLFIGFSTVAIVYSLPSFKHHLSALSRIKISAALKRLNAYRLIISYALMAIIVPEIVSYFIEQSFGHTSSLLIRLLLAFFITAMAWSLSFGILMVFQVGVLLAKFRSY